MVKREVGEREREREDREREKGVGGEKSVL